MIGAGLSFYKSGANYLAGNAKIYDGTLDYDVATGALPVNYTQTISFLSHVLISPTTSNFIFSTRATTNTGLFVARNSVGGITVQYTANSGFFDAVFNGITITAGYYCLVVVKTNSLFSGTSIRLWINGVEAARTSNTTSGIAGSTATNSIVIGASNLLGGNKFVGRIRQLEIINRVATPSEVLAASAAGSFRGAGIAHNSGQYLLAVDFDKTGAVPPTTFANTPPYTITSFGGAAYTPYL